MKPSHMQRTQVRGNQQISDSFEQLLCVLKREERCNLMDAEQQKFENDIRVSQFDSLNLSEYVMANEQFCNFYHKNCKKRCKWWLQQKLF